MLEQKEVNLHLLYHAHMLLQSSKSGRNVACAMTWMDEDLTTQTLRQAASGWEKRCAPVDILCVISCPCVLMVVLCLLMLWCVLVKRSFAGSTDWYFCGHTLQHNYFELPLWQVDGDLFPWSCLHFEYMPSIIKDLSDPGYQFAVGETAWLLMSVYSCANVVLWNTHNTSLWALSPTSWLLPRRCLRMQNFLP